MYIYVYVLYTYMCVYVLYIGAYVGEQFSSVRTCKEVKLKTKKRGPMRTVITYISLYLYIICVYCMYVYYRNNIYTCIFMEPHRGAVCTALITYYMYLGHGITQRSCAGCMTSAD